MKYLVVSLLSVCLIGILSFKPIEKFANKNGEVKAAAGGISFIEGDWKKALAKAKTEKKPTPPHKKIKPSYLPGLRHHPSILIYIPSSRICADPKEKKEENLTSPVCNP